jgi:F-type H+-transporting ATPase subunit delta
MQAAARESYEAALDRVEALAGDQDALAGLADEILGVARVLAREPRLRRALSDPGRGGEDRVGLLRRLLDGKVGADALDALAMLVRGRWSTGTELLDATERLGVEAAFASAERAGALGDVEDELFRFGQIVDGDHRLAAALGDSTATLEQRSELVRALLSGKANAVTVRLAEVALAGFGGRGFVPSLTRLVELAADRRDRSVAYVMVAAPLTDEEERRLGDKLTELYGREVSLKTTVDPNVLGGLSVQIGQFRYDGTIRRRLTDIRNALAGRL